MDISKKNTVISFNVGDELVCTDPITSENQNKTKTKGPIIGPLLWDTKFIF